MLHGAGRQSALPAGQLHGVHHVRSKGQIQQRLPAAGQAQHAAIAFELLQQPRHDHPIVRAKQAARPQNNIGGLRVDLRLRQQPLLGGVLAGGIVVGEAPGAITLIKIVMRLKIEVDCRRGDMHEAPHAAAPGRLRQLVRRCGVDAVKFRFAARGEDLAAQCHTHSQSVTSSRHCCGVACARSSE